MIKERREKEMANLLAKAVDRHQDMILTCLVTESDCHEGW